MQGRNLWIRTENGGLTYLNGRLFKYMEKKRTTFFYLTCNIISLKRVLNKN